MVGIRPRLDPFGTLETVVKLGATKEDAKSPADYRRIKTERLPLWMDFAVQAIAGRHPHMPDKASAWRLVIKAGCIRMSKQPEIRKMRTRNLAAISTPQNPHDLYRLAHRRPYVYSLVDTMVTAPRTVSAFNRHADFIDSYAADMRLQEDDVTVLVGILGLASSTGATGAGFVPDVFLGMAMDEHEGFTDWVYHDVYDQR